MPRESCITPDQVLDLIGSVIESFLEAEWKTFPYGSPYEETFREITSRITLEHILSHVAYQMAQNNQVFDSDYRHGATPLHSAVWRILGHGTVVLNHRIAQLRSESPVR